MWQLIVGAVAGFFGPIIQQYFKLKEKKLDILEREKDRAHELLLINAEAEVAVKRLTVEGELQVEEEAQRAFSESYKFANQNLIPEGQKLTGTNLKLVVAVEVLSKAIRPLTTIYYSLVFAAIYTWLAYQIYKTGQVFIASEDARAIFRECTYSLVGLTETCTLWWYGIRQMSKKAL